MVGSCRKSATRRVPRERLQGDLGCRPLQETPAWTDQNWALQRLKRILAWAAWGEGRREARNQQF